MRENNRPRKPLAEYPPKFYAPLPTAVEIVPRVQDADVYRYCRRCLEWIRVDSFPASYSRRYYCHGCYNLMKGMRKRGLPTARLRLAQPPPEPRQTCHCWVCATY